MQNLTVAEAAVAGGIFGGLAIFGIIFYILLIIAGWRIFKKAGERGWKILIPIYNYYILFKIIGMKGWFWGIICVSLIYGIIIAACGVDPSAADPLATATNATLVSISSVIYVIFAAIMDIMLSYRLSRAFGHGLGYTFGLILLPNIFMLILAFGRSKYHKKAVIR